MDEKEEEELRNTRLSPGIGTGGFDGQGSKQKPPVQLQMLFPTNPERIGQRIDGSSSKVNDGGDDHERQHNNEQHGKSNSRKKLMLTKEQSSILEDIFKDHNTLRQKEKQELAAKLNLHPRQVEVWFQNRRARIKSKQVVINCEIYKKSCENLRNENVRLKNELQELKSIAFEASTKVTTICPSCQKITVLEEEGKMEREIFGAREDSSMTS